MNLKRYYPTAIIVVAFGISYAFTFDSKLATIGDNATYYLLGKALAEGHGFVNLASLNPVPHNHYPIGYPLVISALLSVTGGSLIAVKILNGFFLLASLFVLHQILLEAIQDEILSLGVVLLTLTNAHLLFYASVVMSEIPFLFFSLLAIWMLLRLDLRKPALNDPKLYLLIVVLAISIYLRTAAVTIVGASIVYLAMLRAWKHALATIGGILVLIAPLIIRVASLGRSSYLNQLLAFDPYNPDLGLASGSDLIGRFAINAGRYLSREIPNLLMPVVNPDYTTSPIFWEWILGLSILSIIGIGLWKLPQFRELLVIYILLTLTTLLLWPPAWTGVRFVLPITPLIYLCLIWGLKTLVGDRRPVILLVSVGILILLNLPAMYAQAVKAKSPYTPGWTNYFQAASWAGKNITADEEVICSRPELFYSKSGRAARRIPPIYNSDRFIDFMRAEKIKYVLVDRLNTSSQRILFPLMQGPGDQFEVVFRLEKPDTYVIKLNN